MNEVVMCKCGKNPAVYNESAGEYELCHSCQTILCGEDPFTKEMKKIGFGKIYTGASKEDFNKDFWKDLLHISENFNKNILFIGDSFVGKTHLLAAIAKNLICNEESSYTITYYNTVNMYIKIAEDITQFHTFVEKFSEVKYLMLDEITPPRTDWENRLLYTILEERKNNGMITFSATNFELDKLNPQIVSRLLVNGLKYNLTKKSWSNK